MGGRMRRDTSLSLTHPPPLFHLYICRHPHGVPCPLRTLHLPLSLPHPYLTLLPEAGREDMTPRGAHICRDNR